jgi:succinoglycan biosynthesis protein ExoO
VSAAPDVSVIIPTWKAAGFVQRSIASALASEDVSLEVIVVDDASPDETFAVVQQLAASDPRVLVDRLPVNGGPSAARNRAIERASGRYVAVLDADDSVDPARLARLVRLADDTGADVVADNMIEVDEDGRQIGDLPFLKSVAFTQPRDIDLATWIAHNHPMDRGDCLGYLKPVFRRSELDRTGLRYDPALRNSEDYYLIAYLLASGARLAYAPEPGYRYQRSTGSTSHRLKPAHTGAWLVAEREFQNRSAALTLSLEASAALKTRMRRLRDVHQFVSVMDAVKTRRLARLPGAFAADISATPYTLSTFGLIVLGKLTGRKQV